MRERDADALGGLDICLEVSVQPDELSAGLVKRRNICNHKMHMNDDIYC